MKLKLFLPALFVALIFCGTSSAAQSVKGDVIVIFNNPFPDVSVTEESLNKNSGVHYRYVDSVAKSLDAEIKIIYDVLSIDGNNIMALFHSDSKSETDLWFELRMRNDVKGASLNRIKKPSIRKKAH